MRIAFVTPEFVTEYSKGGGLANYLNRMSRALLEAGHEVEVFVLSDRDEALDHRGVLVHRVRPLERWLALSVGRRLVKLCGMKHRLGPLLRWLPQAKAMSDAVRRREREVKFDLLQSADFQASGLLLRRNRRRRDLVRCSGALDLCLACSGRDGIEARWQVWLERRATRRADRAYAPSKYVADHFRCRHRIDLGVLRPPRMQEVPACADPHWELPARYFIHFGQLKKIKGTEQLVHALMDVWDECPDFRMVWAGTVSSEVRALIARTWRTGEERVMVLGAIEKPQLYAALQGAEAAVLPSLVDNLPNTVIESLTVGVPVIGFCGASVDELVDGGKTGELVAMGDTRALARAMIRWWRGEAPVQKGFRWDSDMARQMEPRAAVEALLRFARLGGAAGG